MGIVNMDQQGSDSSLKFDSSTRSGLNLNGANFSWGGGDWNVNVGSPNATASSIPTVKNNWALFAIAAAIAYLYLKKK